MKINNEKKTNLDPLCTPLAPNLGGGGFYCHLPPKNLGRNAPLPEDSF